MICCACGVGLHAAHPRERVTVGAVEFLEQFGVVAEIGPAEVCEISGLNGGAQPGLGIGSELLGGRGGLRGRRGLAGRGGRRAVSVNQKQRESKQQRHATCAFESARLPHWTTSLLFGDGERAGTGSKGIRDAKSDYVKRKMTI